MKTALERVACTDKSVFWNVVIINGSLKTTISTYSHAAANSLEDAISQYATHIEHGEQVIEEAPKRERPMTALEAVAAMRARFSGEFDCPELLACGPRTKGLGDEGAMIDADRIAVMGGWKRITDAPRDGTPIHGLEIHGELDIVQWEENRSCMLGPRAGSHGAGWQNVENKLPVDAPSFWLPTHHAVKS